MTEERHCGDTVTDGGAPDGQELPKLIENAKENGIKLQKLQAIWHMSVIIIWKSAERDYIVTRPIQQQLLQQTGTLRKVSALIKMLGCRCPAGELSTRVEKNGKNGNTYLRYIFSKVTCGNAPQENAVQEDQTLKQEATVSTQASEKILKGLNLKKANIFRANEDSAQDRRKEWRTKEAHGLRKADSRGLLLCICKCILRHLQQM